MRGIHNGLTLLVSSIGFAVSCAAQTLAPPLNPFVDDPIQQNITVADERSQAKTESSPVLDSPEPDAVEAVDTDAFIGLIGEDVPTGVKVLSINAGGPAEQAGILPGDVVYGFRGHRIRTSEEIATALAGLRPGLIVQLVVNREGEARQISLKLGTRRRPVVSARRSSPGDRVSSAGDAAMLRDPSDAMRASHPQSAEAPSPTLAEEQAELPIEDDAVGEESLHPANVASATALPADGDSGEESLVERGPASSVPEIYRASSEKADVSSTLVQNRASLGARVVDIDAENTLRYGPAIQQGALIVSIERASAADRANLMPGMVITALNGQPVLNADDLEHRLASTGVGEQALIAYQLGSVQRSVSVQLDSRSSADEQGAATVAMETVSRLDASDASRTELETRRSPRTIEVVALPAEDQFEEPGAASHQRLERQYESMQVELEVLRQTVVKLEARLRGMQGKD